MQEKELLKIIDLLQIKEITTDLIPKYLGRIYNVTTNYYHRDIGNLKSYSQCKIDINKMEI